MHAKINRILTRLRLAGIPDMVTILISVNILTSLLYWIFLFSGRIFGYSASLGTLLIALPASPLQFITRPWTILSYMVVQADALQLIFNMLWLLWFGRMLHDTDSSRTLITLYIGGGIFGGICYILANIFFNGGATYLIGSSASILAVMVYTALRQPDRSLNFFIIGAVKLKWIAIVTIGITLIGATGIPQHCAHLGGAAFPFLLIAANKLRNRKRKPARRKPKILNADRPVRPVSPTPANTDEQMLDSLLDKIRISGFNSLSDKEKKLLDELSRKIR